MEERGQDGSADHDVGCDVGILGADALSEALGALHEVGGVGGLVDTGQEDRAGQGDGVGGGADGQSKFEVGRQRDEALGVNGTKRWSLEKHA